MLNVLCPDCHCFSRVSPREVIASPSSNFPSQLYIIAEGLLFTCPVCYKKWFVRKRELSEAEQLETRWTLITLPDYIDGLKFYKKEPKSVLVL